VENAAAEKQEVGCAVPEKRRCKNFPTDEGFTGENSHIQSFKYRERHWGKSDAPYWKYLPSDLNVRKMWTFSTRKNKLI
jgi:hypothetical protein